MVDDNRIRIRNGNDGLFYCDTNINSCNHSNGDNSNDNDNNNDNNINNNNNFNYNNNNNNNNNMYEFKFFEIEVSYLSRNCLPAECIPLPQTHAET